eukprot:TRINITY_DN6011_c0_g3_i1.p1 TRINITY_DN6011_c0_g3~~TRINITY_DN6011_c0_g3_i1.p1  ORF type:complete len:277 (-),score=88.40 TRINITY_DN6011_c0_g3_i1:144-974(-)
MSEAPPTPPAPTTPEVPVAPAATNPTPVPSTEESMDDECTLEEKVVDGYPDWFVDPDASPLDDAFANVGAGKDDTHDNDDVSDGLVEAGAEGMSGMRRMGHRLNPLAKDKCVFGFRKKTKWSEKDQFKAVVSTEEVHKRIAEEKKTFTVKPGVNPATEGATITVSGSIYRKYAYVEKGQYIKTPIVQKGKHDVYFEFPKGKHDKAYVTIYQTIKDSEYYYMQDPGELVYKRPCTYFIEDNLPVKKKVLYDISGPITNLTITRYDLEKKKKTKKTTK